MEAAAEGLLAVTNANLGAAIRLSLFEKGLDPRDFVMIAFGGAAGLHAIAVADELGIRRVVFPESASTLSAYGILHSNLAHDLVRSQGARGQARQPADARGHGRRPARRRRRRASTATPCRLRDRQIELAADMRYKGQAFELTVPARGSAPRRGARSTQLIAGFHDIHRQRFSYANPGSPVEIVSLRVSADRPAAEAGGQAAAPVHSERKPARHRKVWMGGALARDRRLEPRPDRAATCR